VPAIVATPIASPIASLGSITRPRACTSRSSPFRDCSLSRWPCGSIGRDLRVGALDAGPAGPRRRRRGRLAPLAEAQDGVGHRESGARLRLAPRRRQCPAGHCRCRQVEPMGGSAERRGSPKWRYPCPRTVLTRHCCGPSFRRISLTWTSIVRPLRRLVNARFTSSSLEKMRAGFFGPEPVGWRPLALGLPGDASTTRRRRDAPEERLSPGRRQVSPPVGPPGLAGRVLRLQNVIGPGR
jgi:hypothetical protein